MTRAFLMIVLAPLFIATTVPDDWKHVALTAAAPDIDRANDDWTRAIVTGDADVLSAPYDADGVFIAPDGSAVRGKAAVRDMYAEPRPGGLKVTKANIHSDGRAAATPDEVYEWGSAEMTVERDGKKKFTSGRYLTVWHRKGAHWLITRNIAF